MNVMQLVKEGRLDHRYDHKYVDALFYVVEINKVDKTLGLKCRVCLEICNSTFGPFYHEAYIHVVNNHWSNFPKIGTGIRKLAMLHDYLVVPHITSTYDLILLLLIGDLSPVKVLIAQMIKKYPTDIITVVSNDDRREIFRKIRECFTTCIMCGREYDSVPAEEVVFAHIAACASVEFMR